MWELTIEELAERVAVPVRTIRFYITEGLLAGPGGRGKAAIYGEEHLLRLQLIRRLVDQHLPLKEIRERLAALSISDVRAILAEERQQEEAARRDGQALSPREYVSNLLARAKLARTPSEPARAAVAPPVKAKADPLSAPDIKPTPAAKIVDLPTQTTIRQSAKPREGGLLRRLEECARGYRSYQDSSIGLWRRWELTPGVELHIREDVQQTHSERMQRLLRDIRELLEREEE
ncbi:MAG: MerR family transcriptional regulator [Chloroflexota bacterium]